MSRGGRGGGRGGHAHRHMTSAAVAGPVAFSGQSRDMLIDVLRQVATGGQSAVDDELFHAAAAQPTLVFQRNSKMSSDEIACGALERLGFPRDVVQAYVRNAAGATPGAASAAAGGLPDDPLFRHSTIRDFVSDIALVRAASLDLFETMLWAIWEQQQAAAAKLAAGSTPEPPADHANMGGDESEAVFESMLREERETLELMYDSIILPDEAAAAVSAKPGDQVEDEDDEEAEGAIEPHHDVGLRIMTIDEHPILCIVRVYHGYPHTPACVSIEGSLTPEGRRKIIDAALECLVPTIGSGSPVLLQLVGVLNEAVTSSYSSHYVAPAAARAKAASEAQRIASSHTNSAAQQDRAKVRKDFVAQLVETAAVPSAASPPPAAPAMTTSKGSSRGPKSSASAAASPPQATPPSGQQQTVTTLLPAPVKLQAVDAEVSRDAIFRSTFPRRNAKLDEQMSAQWQHLKAHGKLQSVRHALPAQTVREELRRIVKDHRCVVVCGETGSGKTTQVPQYLLEYFIEEGRGSEANVLCTQPRRLAATSVALRVAEERDEDNIGDGLVGYSIRLENKVGPRTKLLYCTTGILLRRLQLDPFLGQVTHIVVDEIHERGVDTDFTLILLKDLLQQRKDLTVVLMSATLDAALFSNYFSGAPVMTIPGRTHPVTVLRLESVVPLLHYRIEEDSPYSKTGGASRKTSRGQPSSRGTRKPGTDVPPPMSRHATNLQRDMTESTAEALWEAEVNDVLRNAAGTGLLVAAAATGPAPPPPPEGSPAALLATPPTMQFDDAASIANMDPDRINYDLIARLIDFIDSTFSTAPRNAAAGAANPPRGAGGGRRGGGRHHDDDEPGAVLVFLPGMAEIVACMDEILSDRQLASRLVVHNLHSSLGSTDQRAVFARPPKGKRKIVLGTNIMETSITIDDVVFVIDTGKHKENRYDPRRALSQLIMCDISRAAAKQRCGRAGRVRAGVCFQLYTSQFMETRMEAHQVCEMHRVPLESLILQIHLLNLGDEMRFLSKALSPPEERAVTHSVTSLMTLGALTDEKRLSSLGFHLASLPLDVRVGKMIIHGAVLRCLDPVLTIAAALSAKSPFLSSFEDSAAIDAIRRAFSGDYHSDSLAVWFAYAKWLRLVRGTLTTPAGGGPTVEAKRFCQDAYVSWSNLTQIQALKKQYERYLVEAGFVTLAEDANLLASGAAASAHAPVRVKGGYGHFLFPEHVSMEGHVYEAGGRSFNENSNKQKCITACLVAGLYPNLCRRDRSLTATYGGGSRPRLVGKDGTEVTIHPSSVNGGGQQLVSMPDPFLCYVDKVKTSTTFIRETTMVSAMTLVLFGGPSKLLPEYQEIVVDGWVNLRCGESDGALLIHLRGQLESALAEKINNPQASWGTTTHNVVRAMLRLLAEEGRETLVVVAPQDRRLLTKNFFNDPNTTSTSGFGAASVGAGAGGVGGTTGGGGGGGRAAAVGSNLPKAEKRMQERRSRVACFNCSEKGHLARDCTNQARSFGSGPTVRCFLCGARSHFPPECPALKPQTRGTKDDDDDDG